MAGRADPALFPIGGRAEPLRVRREHAGQPVRGGRGIGWIGVERRARAFVTGGAGVNTVFS